MIYILTKEHETKFLRLGRSARVRPELQAFTADSVSRGISSCDKLTQLYNSFNIVATTCLATDHAAIVNRDENRGKYSSLFFLIFAFLLLIIFSLNF